MPHCPEALSLTFPLAGEPCLREAVQEEAPTTLRQRGVHVLVDGSLRDHEWYTSLINSLRVRYPVYRFAILHVTADPSTVRRRVEQRNEKDSASQCSRTLVPMPRPQGEGVGG